MTIKEIYYYEREKGKITVSPEKPDMEYQINFRLIADSEKILTKDGLYFTSCVDVISPDGWYEVDLDDNRHEPSEPSEIK